MPYDKNDDLIDDEIIRNTKKHERPVNYMYLDTLGNVTAGIGRMIPDTNTAKSLQFRFGNKTDGRYATASETENAFKKVKSSDFGKNIGYQIFEPDGKKYDRLYVDEETQEAWLAEDLKRSERELQKKFENFDEYPKPAKQALLDMQFNMGNSKFQEEVYNNKTKRIEPAWLKLFEAVRNEDWKTAGDESRRGQINNDRNSYTRNLFYSGQSKEGD